MDNEQKPDQPREPSKRTGRKSKPAYDWYALRPDQQEAYRALGMRSDFYPQEDLGPSAGPGDPRLAEINRDMPEGLPRASGLFNWPDQTESHAAGLTSEPAWLHWGHANSFWGLIGSAAVGAVLTAIAILGAGYIVFWKVLLATGLAVCVFAIPVFTWLVFNPANHRAIVVRPLSTVLVTAVCFCFAWWSVSSFLLTHAAGEAPAISHWPPVVRQDQRERQITLLFRLDNTTNGTIQISRVARAEFAAASVDPDVTA